MAPIRILPPDVVNKIAAGEVVERPASVVKELVENALDAGATEIRVDAEDGGRRLIRVTDNGSGIAPEDLPLAFASHATSKLSAAEDLWRISTFGFRGEALASVGAVARVRLVSRSEGRDGAEIVVEYGAASPVRPAAAAPGTVVEVRNLFHNVPVRRRFLRSAEVETEHVVEAFWRFAVARPEVRFELFLEGERRYCLAPAERRSRIGVFFGEEVAGSLLEISREDFHAYLAPPQHSRVNAKGLCFFLNGRFIRDRVLMRAVNEAYREMIPHGRYPVAFLFLSLPPEEVDVNVHPTKIEVRFRSVWKLHDRIAAALRGRLLGGDLAPRVEPPSREAAVARGAVAAAGGASGAVVEFFSSGGGAPPLVSAGRRVFQVHDRYLVEEVEDGLRIIDQHALHERVMLEDLRRQYANASIPRQRLLMPAVVELDGRRRARLDECRELLESFGIEVEDYGRDAVAVRAVPALVAESDPAALLTDLLDLEKEEPGQSMLDRALGFLACRAAVKFGRRLSGEEIARLLEDASALDFSSACAHGRPTAVKLTLDDLERYFRR